MTSKPRGEERQTSASVRGVCEKLPGTRDHSGGVGPVLPGAE